MQVMHRIGPLLFVIPLLFLTGCGAAERTAQPRPQRAAIATEAPRLSSQAALDPNRIGTLVGGKAEQAGRSVKVSFPRSDVPVEVDGWKMPPFMGLTTWVTFAPAEKPGIEAMIMGDLVLFEDEVNPVMSALLEGGVEVSALHNHFFFDKPRVFFMHVGGEGSVDSLAKALQSGFAAQKNVRRRTAQPAVRFEGTPVPQSNSIDGAKVDAILGVRGTSKDGMYKAVMGRRATAACGCSVGKAEGVNTWAAFAGADDDAVVDGDFAVVESELLPVLKSLRSSGIDVVAIHHHMTGETPRILFLHYWGRGKAAELAAAVKKALDLTAWDKG